MNNTVNTLKIDENVNSKEKLPLWFIVLFTAILLFTLTSLAVYLSNKANTDSEIKAQQSELESQKTHLLAQSDVLDTTWLRTLNPIVKKVEGRLLWSTTLQQGIMEFKNLPKQNSDHQYKLWVYDLTATSNKAIEVASFRHVHDKTFLVSFTPYKKINSPLKFELTLETKGEQLGQPLLLAQP